MWEKWLAGGETFSRLDTDLALYYCSPDSLERRRAASGELLRDLDLKRLRPHQCPES